MQTFTYSTYMCMQLLKKATSHPLREVEYLDISNQEIGTCTWYHLMCTNDSVDKQSITHMYATIKPHYTSCLSVCTKGYNFPYILIHTQEVQVFTSLPCLRTTYNILR